LIYGSRRLFVARHLNIPLLVEVKDLSDHDEIVALDIDDRQRKDLSPYERGRSYGAWIRSRLVNSQDELSRVLKVSPSPVSRLLRLAQLPAVLVSAFTSPLDICVSWGRRRMEMWEEPTKRAAVTSAARRLAEESPRPPAAAIYQRLITCADGSTRTKRAAPRDQVIRDDGNVALFRVQVSRNSLCRQRVYLLSF